jgi:hypothetical protein
MLLYTSTLLVRMPTQHVIVTYHTRIFIFGHIMPLYFCDKTSTSEYFVCITSYLWKPNRATFVILLIVLMLAALDCVEDGASGGDAWHGTGQVWRQRGYEFLPRAHMTTSSRGRGRECSAATAIVT